MKKPSGPPTGYAHPGYVASLARWGTPRVLPRSGGLILERPIPGTPHRDAMGPYPLFTCRDWSGLHLDLEEVGSELISLSAVADPFGEYDEVLLRRCFGDLVVPFKEHYVTDLDLPLESIPSKHHRYYVRKVSRKVSVEEVGEPARSLDEWAGLYAFLAERHGLAGIKAFSRESFAGQLAVPGLVMLRAVNGRETVGMHLWYVAGEVAYSHLAAAGPRGYELMAAYALYQVALERFSGRVRWLDLGAGAGVGGDAKGLSRFKKGWSTGTRTAYFCGRIFDRERYEELSHRYDRTGAGYFPAYRAGELV